MLQNPSTSAEESAALLNQIKEIKTRIIALNHNELRDTFEDAIKWLGIDTLSMQDLKERLSKTVQKHEPSLASSLHNELLELPMVV
jgi:hypothetical protein